MKLYIIKNKAGTALLYILVNEDELNDFEWKLKKIDVDIYDDFNLWHWGSRDINPDPEHSRYVLEIQDFDSLSVEDKISALMHCVNTFYRK